MDSELDRSGRLYTTFTGYGSTIVRSIALACVALVWLFAGGVTASQPRQALSRIDSSFGLTAALLCSILALLLDLLQYVYGSAVWGCYHWALTQIRLNDRGGVPSRRVSRGWRILTRLHMVKRIKRSL